MRLMLCRAALLALFALLATAHAAAQTLQAPVDVAARRAVWGEAALQFACPAPPLPVRDLAFEPFYGDASASLVDAARYARYQEAVEPIRRYERDVVDMANRWMRTRPADPAIARCAVRWLDAWARADALLGRTTAQGGYVRQWALAALALAWLQLRQAPDVDVAASARVVRWLAALAVATRAPYEPERSGNNLLYWAALAAAATAVATDDRALLDWAIARYRVGVAEIQPDGTLPRELSRRSKALHYHLFALAPLVMIAELAAANGLDLYGERDAAIHRLARRALDGVADPSFFVARTGEAQDTTEGGPPGARHLAWIEPYFARFPAQRRPALLDRLRPLAMTWLGGDTTLAFGLP